MKLIFLILALVSFILAATGHDLGHVSTLALGLCFFTAAFLFDGGWPFLRAP